MEPGAGLRVDLDQAEQPREQEQEHPLFQPASNEAELRAKVTVWETFFRLFGDRRSELCFFLPTDRPANINDPLSLMLFTEGYPTLRLEATVRRVLFDASGTQVGVGARLVGISNEELEPLPGEGSGLSESRAPTGEYGAVSSSGALDLDKLLASTADGGGEPPEVRGGEDSTISALFKSDVPRHALRSSFSVLDDSVASQPDAPMPLDHRPPAEPAAAAADDPDAPRSRGRGGLSGLLNAVSDELDRQWPDGSVPPAEATEEGIQRKGRLTMPGYPRDPAQHQVRFDGPLPPVPVVGLDLGTTHSSVAVVEGGQVRVVQGADGQWELPSIIAFNKEGRTITGDEAREMLFTEPAAAVATPKRLLGRRAGDKELSDFLKRLPAETARGDDGQLLVTARGKSFTTPQLCAPVLFALRLMAQNHLQREVRQVVLTVPVSFGERRRRALDEAATLAGLQILDMVEEPVAAALANNGDPEFNDLVAVFDLGGGTLDVTLINVTAEDVQVLGSAGEMWLGGEDFDRVLATAAAEAFCRSHQLDVRHHRGRWQRLLHIAEQAKRTLSVQPSTTLAMDDAAFNNQGGIPLSYTVTLPDFNTMIGELVDRAMASCREVVRLAGVRPSDVNTLYLSGGMTNVPHVQQALTRFFGKPPRTSVVPQHAVVVGAALCAAQTWAASATAG